MAPLGMGIVGMNNDAAFLEPAEFFQDERIPAVEFDENKKLDLSDERERTKLLKALDAVIKTNQAIDPTTPKKLPYGFAEIELIEFDPKSKKGFVKQYPIPPSYNAKFREQIKTWLKDGMIKKVSISG